MADVVFDHCEKQYPNGFKAVTDLSLQINDGEFLVMVGPSGCGKSTTLRMIAGLEEISAGELRIDGKVVNHMAPKDRDIAMVFQNYALYPHMSVGENIGFALKLRKTPKDEIKRRVEEAARVLELTSLLDRKPGQLSGGQRQRVAMGRAIVRQPKAFLMDEPLSNLDAKLRVQMRSEIARIQKDLGVTTFYVTHDQVEAMTMGHRVAVIKAGVLQQVAAPQSLYERPDNVFVAAFIGSPSMNLFEGALDLGANPSVMLGTQRVALPDSLLAERPALRAYDGRSVVVGIRPEDLEDAELVPSHPAHQRVRADVVLVEALGAEIVAHLEIDAPHAATGDPDAVEKIGTAGRSVLIAKLSPRSGVRADRPVELAVDAVRFHFFDPDSTLAIR